MGYSSRKKQLYRKVNTRARGVHHRLGGDYRHTRHTKSAAYDRGSMHGGKDRGLDYTPLFQFLLSKVGATWNTVYSEAVVRLDKPEPIFWLVALRDDEKRDFVRVGESTYFSGLYVDGDGLLQRVNPDLGPENMRAACTCCTHTLNGVRFS